MADQSRKTPAVQTTYIVRDGDTLYSIAWRHRLDFRRLARHNGISAPYALRTGQRLVLSGIPDTRPTSSRHPSSVAAAKPRPATPPAKTSQPAPQAASAPKSAPSVPQPAPKPISAPQTATAAGAAPSAAGWQRPVAGAVDQPYSAARNGIDFVLARGEAIAASRAGEVVFAGQGLTGFMHLIIIKHSDSLLSAYGFDGERLVQEGQQLARGAAVGKGGSSGAPLHFEVRRDGEPIDPSRLIGG